MKRVLWLAILTCLIFCNTSAVHADPVASMEKLAQSVAQTGKKDLPAVVLTPQEEEELVRFIVARYKEKEGKVITERQAAIIAGQMSGMMAVALKFQESFGKGKSQSQKAPKPQALPEPTVMPSGALHYEAEALKKHLATNEFAALDKIRDKDVLVQGPVNRVTNGTWFPDASSIANGRKAIRMNIKGGFTGYIVDDQEFDPAKIMPGDVVLLLCHDIRVDMVPQGKCQVVTHGKMTGQKYEAAYTNQTLFQRVQTPAQ